MNEEQNSSQAPISNVFSDIQLTPHDRSVLKKFIEENPTGVTSLTAGTGISVSAPTGAVTISSSITYDAKTGSSSRGATTASGSQTIAHGLGRTPKLLRITAVVTTGTPVLGQSFGTYDGATNLCLHSYIVVGSGASQASANFVIDIIDLTSSNGQQATATLDSTNITLSWTKVGSGTPSTLDFIWEVTG